MATVRELIFGSHNPYENLDLLPLNNHGWASQSPALTHAIATVKPSLIIEIGTWMGGSARFMAKVAKNHGLNVEIVCIDTFLGSVEHWTKESYLMTLKNGRPNIYEQFLSNTLHEDLQDIITPFPVDSINGFMVLQKYGIKVDMIYIDAGHDYESVSADLKRWPQLLRDGGILVGDDYHHPPIIQAVKDCLPDTVQAYGEKFIWQK